MRREVISLLVTSQPSTYWYSSPPTSHCYAWKILNSAADSSSCETYIFPHKLEGKIPTSLLATWSTTFIKLHTDWGKRTWKCTVYSKIGGGTNSEETMWDQHATAISGWDCRSSESKSKGLFWNLFLSWPQAALASRPLVCRVLTVILRDSKAAANAMTCQMK